MMLLLRRNRPALLRSARLVARHLSSTTSSSTDIPLQKVLVANRGEIACRVLRTCQQWGIPTVAIYSSADGPDCLHARMADEAYLVGTGPAATDSYLQSDAVLQIAQASGADAIHPGYGFLSENADFSASLDKHGIQFIGPPPSAILSMGNKTESKAIMESVGVPVTPGFHDNDQQDVETLYHHAVATVGFPLLIKAVSGGGGKGMRLVTHADDFTAALDSCQREAQASFGDARVLLERYLVRPRHVEVQIVADAHGNCVHLFERDCSLQRRHQKILEEAPASDLPHHVRERLGDMGTRAAQGVGYVNAGTVEFLLDTADPESFYFCEMNTRLQVEHPITEMITGVDLVEWQLRVAAGQELPLAQDEITCHGHAFEARVYAENPDRNFMPATGTVWHHSTPAPVNSVASTTGSTDIRVDSGVQPGQEISVYYDPMISKLIVHGKDRISALDRLQTALRNYHIAGVPTNLDFLVQCVQHPIVRTAGAINTGFLEDHEIRTSAEVPPIAHVAATLVVLWNLEQRQNPAAASRQPWSSQWGSQRLTTSTTESPMRKVETEDSNAVMECRSNRDGSFVIQMKDGDEESYHVQGSMLNNNAADGDMELVVNNSIRMKLKVALKEDGDVFRVCLWPQGSTGDGAFQWSVDLRNPLRPRPAAAAADVSSGDLRGVAPMPGKITRVEKNVGDKVEAGDVVVVLEAMKMEHTCTSPVAGVVSDLRCKEDDVVGDGEVLFVIGNEGE